MKRLQLLFLGIVATGSLYGQIDSNASDTTDNLIWEGNILYNENDSSRGFYYFNLQSLTYLSQGMKVWRIDLPERMRNNIDERYFDRARIYNNFFNYKRGAYYYRQDSTLVSLLPKDYSYIRGDRIVFKRNERGGDSDLPGFLMCPELISENFIAVSDVTGFLLLDKRRGAVRIDINYKRSKQRPGRKVKVHYQLSSATIKTENLTCSSPKLGGLSGFIIHCSDHLFHFNGDDFFVFDSKYKMSTRRPRKVDYRKNGRLMNLTFRYKKYTMAIEKIAPFDK